MKEFDELIRIIRILRGPKGCPWDRAQRVSDYAGYLLEEAYELIEAIQARKPKDVKEELGDLFLILTVIAEIFNDKDKFKIEDALKSINSKLIARHPHVFSDKKLKNKKEVLKYWINAKAKKKKRKTVKDRLPATGAALFLANLYLKESHYLDQGPGLDISRLKADLKKLKLGRNKRKILGQLALHLCQLAYINKIDLESELRALVFKKAAKTPYKC